MEDGHYLKKMATLRKDHSGQLYVQFRVVAPHRIEYRLVVHWLVVGQDLVTPSQVTELLPTVHALVPEQLTILEEAEQKSSQGGYGRGQV